MDQIIQINDYNGKSVVSARDLHEFFEVTTRFDMWIKRMMEYGFTENIDFQRLHKNVQTPNGGKKLVLDDYALTLDTAKEISMLQRSVKGKQARQYFIECEKHLANKVKIKSGDQLILEAVNLLQERVKIQEEALKTLTPKADFADRVIGSKSTFPTTVIAKELQMTAQALNSFLHASGVQYKVNGTWVLYKKYEKIGLVEYKTEIFATRTVRSMEWTEYGRAFIINKVQPLRKYEPLPFQNSLNK